MGGQTPEKTPGVFTNLSARTTGLLVLQIIMVLLTVDLLGRAGAGWKTAGVGTATLFCVLNLLVLRSSSRDRRG